ncbi:MAG: hypothetical protein ABI137_05445 [Antricoccus sp.]
MPHRGLDADPAPRDLEVGLDFAREWIEFVDPGNSQHLIRADLTWLCSRWTCIFAAGCHGIIKDRADDGCCSHGAYFTDEDDQQRVREFVNLLTPAQWQRHPGRSVTKKDWLQTDELDGKPATKTKTKGGACVFLNPPDSPQGLGCALHKLAIDTGLHPLQTKPDVCWQLPVRREQEWVTRPDESTILVTSITEFDRRGWGTGGHDLHWWCTSSPEAHVGVEPMYLTYGPELTAMIGAQAYHRLCSLASDRLDRGLIAPHPASREIID